MSKIIQEFNQIMTPLLRQILSFSNIQLFQERDYKIKVNPLKKTYQIKSGEKIYKYHLLLLYCMTGKKWNTKGGSNHFDQKVQIRLLKQICLSNTQGSNWRLGSNLVAIMSNLGETGQVSGANNKVSLD